MRIEAEIVVKRTLSCHYSAVEDQGLKSTLEAWSETGIPVYVTIEGIG
jgi:hypothetical protein